MVMAREDLVTFLTDGFYGLAFGDQFNLSKAMITNDKDLVDSYRIKFLRADGKIAGYLAAWDAAKNDKEKEAVEGSISFDLGNAIVDPSTAIKQPINSGILAD